MGLSRLTTWVLGLLLTGALLNQSLANDAVTLEKQAWPLERKCEACVTVQFGNLEMRLPLVEVGKLLVINSEASALHILPKSGDPKESVLFLTVNPDKLLRHYEQLGLLQGLGISTNEQLFDAVGKLPADNKSLATLRQLKGIDAAIRYTKVSKGSVHVYWIQSPLPGGSQKVYFVIDGEEVVYLLAGNVNRQFLDAVLANLRITDVP